MGKRQRKRSSIEYVLTRMVACDLGRSGEHAVTIAVRKNHTLAGIKHEGCSARLGDAMGRLDKDAACCATVVKLIVDGVRGKSDRSYYNSIGGFDLSGLVSVGRDRRMERAGSKTKLDTRPATERLNEMRSHTASRAAGFPLVIDSLGLHFPSEKRPSAHYYRMRDKGWFANPEFVRIARRVDGRYVFDEEQVLVLARFRYATEDGCPACGIDKMLQTRARKHSECVTHRQAVVMGVRRAIAALGRLGKGGAT